MLSIHTFPRLCCVQKKVLNIFDRRSFGNKYLCEECESDGRGLFIINVTVASYVDRQVVPRNILDRCYSI